MSTIEAIKHTAQAAGKREKKCQAGREGEREGERERETETEEEEEKEKESVLEEK